MKFKEIHNELSRKQESNKIIFKYPNKIPLIVEKHSDCLLNDITNKKYLVSKDMLMNQLIFIIRKRIELEPSESLFITINNQLCPSNSRIEDIYKEQADPDGFLYMTYTSENTFG